MSAGAAMIGRARRLGDWLGQLRFVAALAGVAALALALRLALRWHRDVANYWGEGYGFFWDIARNLAAGRGYEMIAGTSTAFRVPGYPLFLLGVTGGGWHPWAMVWAGALLGTLTVVATGLMAREPIGLAAAQPDPRAIRALRRDHRGALGADRAPGVPRLLPDGLRRRLYRAVDGHSPVAARPPLVPRRRHR